MIYRTAIKIAVLLCLTVTATSLFAAKDAVDCKDSPIISRFQGSTLLACQHKNYDESALPLGIWKDNQPTPSKVMTASGKTAWYFYGIPQDVSGMEVFRNYESALTKAGFSIPFQCSGTQQCGWELANQGLQPLHGFAGHVGTSNYAIGAAGMDGVFHEMTAHLQRPQGNVDLMLMVIDRDSAQGLQAPVVYLKLIEGQPMKTGEVTVTAKAISKGLAQNGHIALYGIHFATDSSALKASSDKELGEMAKMLKQEPSAHVYIVGHTDDTGVLSHNLKLSRDRAGAVVKALVAQYGISSNRLVAEGVASFAPVASNASEQGRALNRRVEMVLQ